MIGLNFKTRLRHFYDFHSDKIRFNKSYNGFMVVDKLGRNWRRYITNPTNLLTSVSSRLYVSVCRVLQHESPSRSSHQCGSVQQEGHLKSGISSFENVQRPFFPQKDPFLQPLQNARIDESN
ncbi:unnamed protein product [Allacma fusca]|uniref:Uncharacterized protein n=1 Tax=Allacma fusca TaxID=39272 RepID=A0A8J2NRF9_9HEXA|nr:unnamed protein product [Allacma fusca]